MLRTFTVTYDEKGCAKLKETAKRLGGLPLDQTMNRCETIGIDMVCFQKQLGFALVLRHSDGSEWSYDVDEPGKTVCIKRPVLQLEDKRPRNEGNVVHHNFKRR